MRRTYRSKKDTSGALDHRDVMLKMDEKSSAFDAFYIQNIKQNRRELSCVGSSNAYGVASKKVRKRKYVKRIIKEAENIQPRESVSTSTYLTPDKSIRVNKILDPFDELLNSSSTSQDAAATKHSNQFGMLLAKKESKTYKRNKLRRVKKFHYSSEYFSDEDSEKENSTNLQSNTTDIRTHELLVEKEHTDKPKYFDESINKIVNNLSLINNFKHKTINNSFNTSYKHRNRLTKNCHSPILQRSPLCSTPFKEKYRGISIYNFSPISTKEKNSPNYVTIIEDNNESNNSLVFTCKEKVPKLSKEHTSPVTSIPVDSNIPEKSLIYEDEIDYPTDECENESPKQKSGLNTDKIDSVSVSTEQSLLQVTEADQFLGFSDAKLTESITDKYCLLKCFLETSAYNKKVNPGESHKIIISEKNINETGYENNKCLRDKSLEKSLLEHNNLNKNKSYKALQENLTEQSSGLNKSDKSNRDTVDDVNLSYENESTSSSEQNFLELKNNDIKEPKIYIKRLNDSVFLKYYDKLPIGKEKTSSYKNVVESRHSDNDKSANPKASIISKETSYSDLDNSSQDSDKESMYDTCESEQSFSEVENGDTKKPKVATERLSNSVFMKYHDMMSIDKDSKSSCEQSISELVNNDIIIKEPKVAIEKLNASLLMKYYNKLPLHKESTSSCEHSFSQLENNDIKEPKVVIRRLKDSVIVKCYEKIPESGDHNMILTGQSQSEPDETTSDANESLNEVEENSIEIDELNNSTEYDTNASFYNCSHNSISSYSKNCESAEAQSHEIIITDSSTTEDMESNDESNNEDERHVSFVTTRRRNEITNDSMFIFDNSYGSSSTDCDKTVVSNIDRLSIKEKSNVELDINLKKVKTTDTNNFEPEDELTESKNSTAIHINTTRKSSRHNTQCYRRSEYLDSSLNDVTIINTSQINDGRLINVVAPSQTKNTPEQTRSCITTRKSSKLYRDSSMSEAEVKPSIVLQPGKKWERSLSIYRRMTTMADHFDQSLLDNDSQKKGRKYRQSVITTMEMQDSLHNESINSRRSTFISKPSRPTIRFVKDSNNSRISLNTTEVFDDLKGFLNEECDDTVIELSKLSLADSEFEVTVLDNFDETSGRIATARDYVLRRCNQTDPILFDECYPETVLKNCHKIGEGVYGEVFLWRGRDGRARVMKIVPIAGACRVNGEQQKDYHEVISEIVIAMELSALRAPIADIDRYFDEGKDLDALDLHSVENATDVFNEVLAVRCVQGPYPSRLLDLWELYDECKGSENDNPAALPSDQQYMVLELANAGQDLESFQFTGAQQAYALFQQIAFGLAVGEESFQFEHRDLHWGNVLIASTEQKLATFVLRGRTYRVLRGGVAATIIDYSLSRISLPLAAERAALYNDLATDDQLFEAVGDYQFQVYRLMRDKLGNEWKNFEPYTNILWLHYTVDKMITALRYKRTNTKIHKHYIEKLKGIKDKILGYKSATEYVLTDIEI